MKKKIGARIHPTAIIGKDVTLGKNITIGPNVIIYDNVTIGDHSVIGPHVIIGEPDKRFYEKANYKFSKTIIGPHAVIRSSTVIYTGCKIGSNFHTGHNAAIREKATIGNNCSIGTSAVIDGNCILGDYVRMHYYSCICKKSRIGSFVWIYPYTILVDDLHPPCYKCCRGAIIDDYVVLGTQSIIFPGIKIGVHALIGPMSVVRKNVPPETVVYGSPAKNLGSIRDIKCVSGNRVKTPYPWPTHFSHGYPWEHKGWK